MAQQDDQALERELQQARERVSELQKRQELTKKRADLQRQLDEVNAEEQSLGKTPAQMTAPQPAKP